MSAAAIAAAAAATAESAAAEAAVRFICLPTCLTVEKVRKNGNWKRTCLIATHISNTPSTFAPTPRPPPPTLPTRPACHLLAVHFNLNQCVNTEKLQISIMLHCNWFVQIVFPHPHTHTHELHIFI